MPNEGGMRPEPSRHGIGVLRPVAVCGGLATQPWCAYLKCLSVSQPFADLIVSGAKRIELRRWNTHHRGYLLVHAPLKVREDDCRRLGVEASATGAIVGRVRLVDVKRYANAAEVRADAPLHLAGGAFESNRYGFVLEEPVQLKVPVPWRGYPGIFEVRVGDRIGADHLLSDIMEEDFRYRWVGRH